MSTFERITEHIRRTVMAPPTGTIAKFPRMASAGFRSADAQGGARIELEEMVGQSRVFELALEDGQAVPLNFGGPTPIAYRDEIPILIRYESSGPTRKRETLEEIKHDQLAVCDALHRSQWSTVSGLASMQARPGDIYSFIIRDDAGNEYSGFKSEIAVAVSYDI